MSVSIGCLSKGRRRGGQVTSHRGTGGFRLPLKRHLEWGLSHVFTQLINCEDASDNRRPKFWILKRSKL